MLRVTTASCCVLQHTLAVYNNRHTAVQVFLLHVTTDRHTAGSRGSPVCLRTLAQQLSGLQLW